MLATLVNPSLLMATVLLSLSANAAPPLRSPWDGKPVTLTDAAYNCPSITHLPRDLTTDRFYSDSKSSVIDPEKWKAYVASAGPVKQLEVGPDPACHRVCAMNRNDASVWCCTNVRLARF